LLCLARLRHQSITVHVEETRGTTNVAERESEKWQWGIDLRDNEELLSNLCRIGVTTTALEQIRTEFQNWGLDASTSVPCRGGQTWGSRHGKVQVCPQDSARLRGFRGSESLTGKEVQDCGLVILGLDEKQVQCLMIDKKKDCNLKMKGQNIIEKVRRQWIKPATFAMVS